MVDTFVDRSSLNLFICCHCYSTVFCPIKCIFLKKVDKIPLAKLNRIFIEVNGNVVEFYKKIIDYKL